jgi:PAS domain S-box-containing protein
MDQAELPPSSFELICSMLPQLVYVHDLDTCRTVYVNRPAIPAENAEDAEHADLLLASVHPEDRSRVQARLQRAASLRALEPGSHAFRLRAPDGSWQWFEARDSVLQRHPGGRLWQLLGSGQAIDERKRAEAQALDNSRLLHEVESAPIAVIEFDADDERLVRRWGGDAERMFGWAADEVLGRPLRALGLIHPDDREVVLQMLQSLLQGQSTRATWSNRNLDRQHRLLHCTWHNTLIAAAGPGPGRVLSLALDITGHQQAEQALLASEQRHRLLAETLLHGVVHQDASGRIIAMNPAAERILGKTREHFLGSDSVQEEHDTVREDGSLFPGDQHPSMLALKTGQPVRGVVMGVWHPQRQQRRWLRVDAMPVRPPWQDTVAEVYTVFEDISEQRAAEQAQREADRQKDLFIATLAHELRNPLAPIHNAALLLRNRHLPRQAEGAAPADPDSLRWAAVIQRQAAHMARLLDDLLDVSRMASGRLLLRPERLQLASVVEQAIETARPQIDAAGHSLEVHLPADPVELLGDGVRLAQVCANLLTNAAKYSEPGGRIVVQAAREGSQGSKGNEVAIRVQDSGIGLAPEHLRSIFEMFGQVDASPERSHGGMGIGLALARGLVQLHGGSISAHSAGPGKGSEFVVRLPVVPPLQQPAPAPAAVPVAAPARRILVVDDNLDAAQTLALLLSMDGHAVQTAADGIEALARADVWPPDVALLDLGMPRMNGYDLCRALRARPGGAALLLVAVSGWGQEQDRQRSSDAGFDAHLVKPVRYDQLEALLALPRSRQQAG